MLAKKKNKEKTKKEIKHLPGKHTHIYEQKVKPKMDEENSRLIN